MSLLETILIGFSLAMDAFAISICIGLQNKKKQDGIIISFLFGLFQFIMPILGFYLGNIFTSKIINYNPYISTILLVTIGILMLREDNNNYFDKLNLRELILLSIATSIDALVIGISFSFFKINILLSSSIIGIITFSICLIGFYLGNLFNKKVGKYSNFIGGITLISLGLKFFIENLFR